MTTRGVVALLATVLAISRPEGVEAQTALPGSVTDTLVAVGGHKMHIHCVGPTGARPVVILEAGGSGSAREWTSVQGLLSPHARSCAYDRAGLGSSEPGPTPRTMRQAALELHALLESARIGGPFVLVGQSIGGLIVRTYADQYGGDVIGAVLLDPTHENAVLGSIRYGGWVRLREKASTRPIPEPRLVGSIQTTNEADDYLAEELQQLYLARQQNPQPLGRRPLIVLGAGNRVAPPGTPDEQWLQLRTERDGQVVDLSRLSSNSRFVLDPGSTHAIHIDNPRLAARAIEEVLSATSTGAALVPCSGASASAPRP